MRKHIQRDFLFSVSRTNPLYACDGVGKFDRDIFHKYFPKDSSRSAGSSSSGYSSQKQEQDDHEVDEQQASGKEVETITEYFCQHFSSYLKPTCHQFHQLVTFMCLQCYLYLNYEIFECGSQLMIHIFTLKKIITFHWSLRVRLSIITSAIIFVTKAPNSRFKKVTLIPLSLRRGPYQLYSEDVMMWTTSVVNHLSCLEKILRVFPQMPYYFEFGIL